METTGFCSLPSSGGKSLTQWLRRFRCKERARFSTTGCSESANRHQRLRMFGSLPDETMVVESGPRFYHSIDYPLV